MGTDSLLESVSSGHSENTAGFGTSPLDLFFQLYIFLLALNICGHKSKYCKSQLFALMMLSDEM